MIWPVSWRWTPSGFTSTRVRSVTVRTPLRSVDERQFTGSPARGSRDGRSALRERLGERGLELPHLVEQRVDGLVLRLQMGLDLLGLVEGRVGILVGHVGPLLGGPGKGVLADQNYAGR